MESFIRNISQTTQNNISFISLASSYEDTLSFQPWKLTAGGNTVKDVLLSDQNNNSKSPQTTTQNHAPPYQLYKRWCVCDADGWVVFLAPHLQGAVLLAECWIKNCTEFVNQNVLSNWFQLLAPPEQTITSRRSVSSRTTGTNNSNSQLVEAVAQKLSLAVARLVRFLVYFPLNPLLLRGTSKFQLLQYNENLKNVMLEIRFLLRSFKVRTCI
jgi:hypothetical protein